MDMQLKGKVALITGGASGIGFATAQRLASEGVKLAIVDINKSAAENAVQELRSITAAIAVAADVSREEEVKSMAQAVLAEVPGALLARDSAGRLTDIAVDHSEFTRLAPDRIEQVAALMRAHGLTATVSSIHINGWIGDHDKWSGARWAVEQALGLPFVAEEWLYLGDSTNDQRMFERMPMSVGVANIARFVPQLHSLPGWVTRAERGAGFAELATALLEARAA